MKKLITISVTLVINVMLLATTVYAWFVSNDEADGSALNAQLFESSELIDFENSYAYYLNYDEENDQYSIRDEEIYNVNESLELKKYDKINDTIRKEEILFKLKINTNDNGFKIKAFSQTKDYTASLSDTNKDTALALSNIISFSQVDVIGSQIEILNQVSFVDDDQNKTTEVVIVDEQDADYCYFIIDFDDNLLDEIYSENLGSPELDESLAFNQDFKILAVI